MLTFHKKTATLKLSFTHTNPNIPVIYEDNHLLVIDKPAGVLSQEDRTGKPDVLSLCKQYLKKKYNKPGEVFLGLVHRLDQPVSGVMALARTTKAASRLSEQVRNRSIQKNYWALVYGITPTEGELKHYLLKDSKTNMVRAFSSKKGKAKEARLTFTTLKQSAHYSLIEITLITGRPHQIRVQFAKAGFPLWGDYKYGSPDQGKGKTLALRAVRLTLIHPTKKEEMKLEVGVPDAQPWNIFEY